ncbi:hypothetical protein B9Z19DRAFT_1069421 [Tuber borchii]|uniref:Uncharacterized protein n=1 Tax=Tuber borchii TaxID=42251 RepID=A0A2T6ZBM2_TUBBO|nr:hypothetical protein B9Z19DRAFT_1069421 [Tuber borchii]
MLVGPLFIGNDGCPNPMPVEGAALAAWHKFALDQATLFENQRVQQTLEDRAMWRKELEKVSKGFQDSQDVLLQRCEKKEQQLQEEINKLTMALLMSKYSKRIEMLNIRGALERIRRDAANQKGISSANKGQATLAEIAESEEFTKISEGEARARGLKQAEVRDSAAFLFKYLSGYAHGYDEPIVVKKGDHPRDERVAIIALLKLQDKWPSPLSWREEE